VKLAELILGHAQRSPAAEAIVGPGFCWSYADLERATRQFVELFRSQGLQPGSRVALVLERSPEAIAALAACSLSGIGFVPLDPTQPQSRLDALLQRVAPDAVLARAASLSLPGTRTCDAGGELKLFSCAPSRERAASPPEMSYVIFTSGSTGAPKGIVMSEPAVVAFMQGFIEFAGLAPGDRLASNSPLHFDFALIDLVSTLASGATLVLANTKLIALKPSLFVSELERFAITHFSGVPTFWKVLLKHASADLQRLTRLGTIFFAGEHFPRSNIEALWQIFPALRILNIYGQSESIACTLRFLERPLAAEQQHLPVGTGHRSVDMFLLDDEGREVKRPGQLGELYLGGPILFDGYWLDPRETSRRLLPDPRDPSTDLRVFKSGDLCFFDESGEYYFVGRKDNQVQIYGNRVEVEEIEAVINTCGSVVSSCVVVHEAEHTTLAAFVVPREADRSRDVAKEVRRCVSERLPEYMRPQSIRFMDALPLTRNGKLDRGALREILSQSPV
jgi:amino acid adenylation domain-containing protein